MAIINFDDIKLQVPLFGVKISPPFANILNDFDLETSEILVKKALGINKKRLTHFETIGLPSGESGLILIIYDYVVKKTKPKILVPENNGFYDFVIYDIDFNLDLNLEKMIKIQKKEGMESKDESST